MLLNSKAYWFNYFFLFLHVSYRGGSFASTYKLLTGDVRKLPGIAEGLDCELHQVLLNTKF